MKPVFDLNFLYLSAWLISKIQVFAYDTSMFSLVFNKKFTADRLNQDKQKLSERTCKWKIMISTDIFKT